MNHATPRKILLAVTGISPQIVTETLYALGCEAKKNLMPSFQRKCI